MADCEICGSRLIQVDTDWAVCGRECPRCGEFRIDTLADGLRSDEKWFSDKEREQMVGLSGWVRDQNAASSIPTITNAVIESVMRRRRPDLTTRAMTALRHISQMEGALTAGVIFYQQMGQDKKILGSTYCYDGSELIVLLRLLEAEQLIADQRSVGFVLTIPGMLKLEKMAATGTEFAQGFVAMWFNPELQPAWLNGFEPAIRNAGYRPFRIDQKDYIGGITDEIITEIRRSRFVVADYTEQVNGVYFEVGFALGLGLNVVPTCREDHIPRLHFDIRHLNTLPWKEPVDLAINLSKRIIAVRGPFVEPNERM